MKRKIGISIYEQIAILLIITFNGMAITYTSNKIDAFILVLGISATMFCAYNAAKTVKARIDNKKNTKNSVFISVVCFIVGCILSGIGISLTFNCVIAYIFWALYHSIIVLVTIPLLRLNT